MTFPRATKLLLMLAPSLRREPCAGVAWCARSLPARSTRCSLVELELQEAARPLTLNTQWLLLDLWLVLVAATRLAPLPFCSQDRRSPASLTSCSDRPGICALGNTISWLCDYIN